MNNEALRVVVIKPSKYAPDGRVERFRRGFMPNTTLLHIQALTPTELDGRPLTVETVDEYTQTDEGYLEHLRPEHCSLLALVGVQSHQMHRALDLAALAKQRGVRACIIGGPHPTTCSTEQVQGRGVSFALAEAELIWETILRDAFEGELRPVYGEGGCPYNCNFCSVVKIAGKQVRSQPVETTLGTLRAARDSRCSRRTTSTNTSRRERYSRR